MADSWNPYSDTTPSAQEIFAHNNRYYLNRGGKSYENYRALGNTGAQVTGTFGTGAHKVGLANLFQMLQQQGRVDPRLLALAQGANKRDTSAQQGSANAMLARGGFGQSGLGAALQGAIGAAGANRASNLRYQDISDSYQRNQENLGLLNQLVIQPQMGYASLGQADLDSARSAKEKRIATGASLIGGGLGAFAR